MKRKKKQSRKIKNVTNKKENESETRRGGEEEGETEGRVGEK